MRRALCVRCGRQASTTSRSIQGLTITYRCLAADPGGPAILRCCGFLLDLDRWRPSAACLGFKLESRAAR